MIPPHLPAIWPQWEVIGSGFSHNVMFFSSWVW